RSAAVAVAAATILVRAAVGADPPGGSID
ncbi:MAG: hypothetical protein QOE31_3074, partial [Solirubrobacteraceae bacterium]|nr:hypothetical protein [Solirubrobacteraceae bacterium]